MSNTVEVSKIRTAGRNSLPAGWRFATIGELSDYVQRGKSPKYAKSKSDLPVVNQKCIRWSGIDPTYFKFVDPSQWSAWQEERFLRVGDILWNSTGTGTIGRAAIFDGLDGDFDRLVVDSHVTIVRPNQFCLPKYLYYFIRSPIVQSKIEKMQSGSTNQVELSKKEVLDTVVPLAPLTEQKQIADKLDVLFASVDSCRERLERVPKILKKFRQSVLLTATSGKLTEDWRKRNNLTKSEWSHSTLSEITEKVFDGPFGSHLKTADYSESGARVIRLENLGHLNFLAEKKCFVPLEKFDLLIKHELRKGDILFSSFIDEEIRVCVFTGTKEPAINKSDCFCIRVDQSVCDPYYLVLKLACHSTFKILEKRVHGVTRPRINLTQLKKLKFEFPTIVEQREIVHRVQSFFELLDSVQTRVQLTSNTIEDLLPSVLSQAFRGKLATSE